MGTSNGTGVRGRQTRVAGASSWTANGQLPSRHSLRDLAELLARLGDGAFVVGAEGRIVLWNGGAQRILGYTAREVVGKRCRDVVPCAIGEAENGADRSCQTVARTVRRERLASFEMRTQAKSGQAVWLNMSIAPAIGPDGGILMAHLFHDVTELRQAAALIREGAAPLPRPVDGPSPVTRRELELLKLLASGASTETIVEHLHVSRNTVRSHLQNIFRKLGVHSRLEAAACANRHLLTWQDH